MSRKLELKDAREIYAAGIDPAQLEREPIILERDGAPVGAVIGLNDYRLYCAWKEQRVLEGLSAQFLEDRVTFQRLLPDLLKTHRGMWVAVYKGQVVDSAENAGDLAERVYARFGYQEIYMDEVLEEPRVYRIPSPRLGR
jgi:hypothetical protein